MKAKAGKTNFKIKLSSRPKDNPYYNTRSIKTRQSQIERLIAQLGELGVPQPRNFSPKEIARITRAQGNADRRAYQLMQRIATLQDGINQEQAKVVTYGRKDKGG